MVAASAAARRGGGDTMWYTYILQSEKIGSLYVGVADDLERRLSEHNRGAGGRYTATRKPFKLIFYEAYTEKGDAYNAERYFKSGHGREVLRRDKLKVYFANHSGIV